MSLIYQTPAEDPVSYENRMRILRRGLEGPPRGYTGPTPPPAGMDTGGMSVGWRALKPLPSDQYYQARGQEVSPARQPAPPAGTSMAEYSDAQSQFRGVPAPAAPPVKPELPAAPLNYQGGSPILSTEARTPQPTILPQRQAQPAPTPPPAAAPSEPGLGSRIWNELKSGNIPGVGYEIYKAGEENVGPVLDKFLKTGKSMVEYPAEQLALNQQMKENIRNGMPFEQADAIRKQSERDLNARRYLDETKSAVPVEAPAAAAAPGVPRQFLRPGVTEESGGTTALREQAAMRDLYKQSGNLDLYNAGRQDLSPLRPFEGAFSRDAEGNILRSRVPGETDQSTLAERAGLVTNKSLPERVKIIQDARQKLMADRDAYMQDQRDRGQEVADRITDMRGRFANDNSSVGRQWRQDKILAPREDAREAARYQNLENIARIQGQAEVGAAAAGNESTSGFYNESPAYKQWQNVYDQSMQANDPVGAEMALGKMNEFVESDLDSNGRISPEEGEYNDLMTILKNNKDSMTPADELRLKDRLAELKKKILPDRAV